MAPDQPRNYSLLDSPLAGRFQNGQLNSGDSLLKIQLTSPDQSPVREEPDLVIDSLPRFFPEGANDSKKEEHLSRDVAQSIIPSTIDNTLAEDVSQASAQQVPSTPSNAVETQHEGSDHPRPFMERGQNPQILEVPNSTASDCTETELENHTEPPGSTALDGREADSENYAELPDHNSSDCVGTNLGNHAELPSYRLLDHVETRPNNAEIPDSTASDCIEANSEEHTEEERSHSIQSNDSLIPTLPKDQDKQNPNSTKKSARPSLDMSPVSMSPNPKRVTEATITGPSQALSRSLQPVTPSRVSSSKQSRSRQREPSTSGSKFTHQRPKMSLVGKRANRPKETFNSSRASFSSLVGNESEDELSAVIMNTPISRKKKPSGPVMPDVKRPLCAQGGSSCGRAFCMTCLNRST